MRGDAEEASLGPQEIEENVSLPKLIAGTLQVLDASDESKTETHVLAPLSMKLHAHSLRAPGPPLISGDCILSKTMTSHRKHTSRKQNFSEATNREAGERGPRKSFHN